MATGAEFDAGYLRWRASEAHAALIGEGLPTRVQPFSFVPLAGLASVLDALALSPGQTLVDLGCGRGGPGLWLAEQARARLIGVDASRVAVADARQRQHLFPTVPHACFTVAEVATTGLPDACAHAVVSIDVLQLVDDQPAMAREAVRLLRPGGRLALTTWEGSGSAPQRFPRDLAGLLADAGLRVDAIVEQPAWAKRQYDIYARAAAAAEAGGDPAVEDLAAEGRRAQAWRHAVRRVLVTAHHPASPQP